MPQNYRISCANLRFFLSGETCLPWWCCYHNHIRFPLVYCLSYLFCFLFLKCTPVKNHTPQQQAPLINNLLFLLHFACYVNFLVYVSQSQIIQHFPVTVQETSKTGDTPARGRGGKRYHSNVCVCVCMGKRVLPVVRVSDGHYAVTVFAFVRRFIVFSTRHWVTDIQPAFELQYAALRDGH